MRRARAPLMTSILLLAACGDGSGDGETSVVLWAVLVALAWIVGIAAAFTVTSIVVLAAVVGIARALQWGWNGSRRG